MKTLPAQLPARTQAHGESSRGHESELGGRANGGACAGEPGGAGAHGGQQRGSAVAVHISQAVFTSLHEKRRLRWVRRQESGRLLRPLATEKDGFVVPVRVAKCGWTIGQAVGIVHDKGLPAGYSSLEHCGSVWACPCCAGTIRSKRAKEVEKAVLTHQEQGGTVLFFTGTLRHHKRDKLAHTLDTILNAWRKTISGKAWQRQREALAISGYIRATEVTLNKDAHGWHPHVHAALFLDHQISEDELAAFRAWLFDRWTQQVKKLGAKAPTVKGLDLQQVDNDGRLFSKYLSKIEGEEKHRHWGVSNEMARGDVKQGRQGSINPMQLLDADLDGYTEQERGKFWREYYETTKGRRCLTWSRGLKERFEVEEKEDAELLKEESTRLVHLTSAQTFRRVWRTNVKKLPQALEHAEAGEMDKVSEILPPLSAPDSSKIDNNF